jgi:hypothetical protein
MLIVHVPNEQLSSFCLTTARTSVEFKIEINRGEIYSAYFVAIRIYFI